VTVDELSALSPSALTWTPDAPLLRVASETEQLLARAPERVERALGACGWTLLARGSTRTVFVHPDVPGVALKYGCPDANRTEAKLTCAAAADPDAAWAGDLVPALWISGGGRFLAMQRCERTLRQAINAGEISEDAAERMMQTLRDHGHQAVHGSNVARLGEAWKIIDFGDSSLPHFTWRAGRQAALRKTLLDAQRQASR